MLRYLKEIAARVVFQTYRHQKRQIVSTLRTKFSGLWDLEAGAVAQTLLACLSAYGLSDPLDLVLLEGLMQGQRMAALTEHPVVHAVLQATTTTNSEKFLYNRRDTALWHAYKNMQRIVREASNPVCLDAIAHIVDFRG